MQAGLVTTVRKTRGDDIAAACGQLAGKVLDRTRRSKPPVIGGRKMRHARVVSITAGSAAMGDICAAGFPAILAPRSG